MIYTPVLNRGGGALGWPELSRFYGIVIKMYFGVDITSVVKSIAIDE